MSIIVGMHLGLGEKVQIHVVVFPVFVPISIPMRSRLNEGWCFK